MRDDDPRAQSFFSQFWDGIGWVGVGDIMTGYQGIGMGE